jgi:hypothetical protein
MTLCTAEKSSSPNPSTLAWANSSCAASAVGAIWVCWQLTQRARRRSFSMCFKGKLQTWFIDALVHHRPVGDLEEAGDVGAVDVVARRAVLVGSVGRRLVDDFMMRNSFWSTSSRVQPGAGCSGSSPDRRRPRHRRWPPCPGRTGSWRPGRFTPSGRSACWRPRRPRRRRSSAGSAASLALISFWVALGNAQSALWFQSGLWSASASPGCRWRWVLLGVLLDAAARTFLRSMMKASFSRSMPSSS